MPIPNLYFAFSTQIVRFCPVNAERVSFPSDWRAFEMDSRIQEQITKLRADGESYTRIAEILHLSINTIKSFCRRNNLSIASSDVKAEQVSTDCKLCGKPLIRNPGKRVKLFCSDQCRMAWWKGNRNKVRQTAWYEFRCDHCGKSSRSYGNRHRKYCSHSCYIQSRFGRSGI